MVRSNCNVEMFPYEVSKKITGHAKHRLLPSQIPYYSYARNLVSLDHVNSTFSQLVVFRQCRSKVLGHLARYY